MRAYVLQQPGKILLEGRFPACDADAVEKGLPFFEIGNYGLRAEGRVSFSREDEIRIMAEGAAELAAREKENSSGMSRIVEKTGLNAATMESAI